MESGEGKTRGGGGEKRGQGGDEREGGRVKEGGSEQAYLAQPTWLAHEGLFLLQSHKALRASHCIIVR